MLLFNSFFFPFFKEEENNMILKGLVKEVFQVGGTPVNETSL